MDIWNLLLKLTSIDEFNIYMNFIQIKPKYDEKQIKI